VNSGGDQSICGSVPPGVGSTYHGSIITPPQRRSVKDLWPTCQGGHVSASTQNQGFNALLFLNQQVLGMEPPRLDAVRARRPKRLPTVLSPEGVRQLLDATQGGKGVFRLMAGLLCGAGLLCEELGRMSPCQRVHPNVIE